MLEANIVLIFFGNSRCKRRTFDVPNVMQISSKKTLNPGVEKIDEHARDHRSQEMLNNCRKFENSQVPLWEQKRMVVRHLNLK